MEAIAAALEASGPAQFLRQSWWAYPLLNIAHLLGLATLFGAILALDLRLLGCFRAAPLAGLEAVSTRVAAAGLALAVVTGLALFAVRAGDYVGMPVLWAKLGFVALGLVNAAGMRASGLARRLPRLTAAISITAWTGAIAAGRLIGYWSS